MAVKDLPKLNCHLFICNGGACKNKGAELSTEIIRDNIKIMGMHEQVHTTKTLCNGRCQEGPLVIVQPENKWYQDLTPENAKQFVLQTLVKGNSMKSLEFFSWDTKEYSCLTKETG